MNDVIINKVAYGCTEGKEAATYFHLCLNVQLLKPITVLYPCLPLLFHTSSRLCSSMALSQGSGHFSFWLDPHNLVITTKRLVLLMLQHHFHLLNMIHFVLTSPGGACKGFSITLNSTEPVILRSQCHVPCKCPHFRVSTISPLQ